ncbi:MAG: hypothetical protein GY732_16015 [Gammaproteobacteria bacterium]|nr:hypothetical protein [Gammaproteobacteria bacterium]
MQLTVDGLRADLLSQYADRFGDDGFVYLKNNRTVFANANYQHANTETTVGHAVLAKGAQPSVHGLTGNVWFDAETGELAYNIEDPDSPMLPTREQEVTGSPFAAQKCSAESAVESQCSGRMSKGGEGYRVFYASDTGVALAATARLINKKLSWTAEYNGFTGSRDTFITSINWRF